MRKIFKYPLVLADRQVIQMPEGAIIRHVNEQMGTLCIWAEVDPDAPLRYYDIEVFGTGHDIPDRSGTGRRYLGSVLARGGSLVWHIYEFSPK